MSESPYEAEYRACVEACAWMVNDKTLHVELGRRYTVEGIAALRAQRDELRADLLAAEDENSQLMADNAKLRAALALGQDNCDAVYEDLREERDAARAERDRLQREGDRLRDWIEELKARNSELLGLDADPHLSLPEGVALMLAQPGVYICGDTHCPNSTLVVASHARTLYQMKLDSELSPERFLPSFIVKSGPHR